MKRGVPATAEKRAESAPKKKMPVGRPFQKGNCANPGGRPKEAPEVKALARVHTVECIGTLVEIMRKGESERSRVAAAESLLCRAWGKPAQPVTGEDGEGPADVIVRATVRYVRARLEEAE